MEDAPQFDNLCQATAQSVGTAFYSEEENKLIVSSTVSRKGKRVVLTIETSFVCPIEKLSRSCTASIQDDLPFHLVDLSICLKHCSVTSDTTKMISDTGSEAGYTHRSQWCIYADLLGVSFLMYSKDSKRWGGFRFLAVTFPGSRRTTKTPKISQMFLKTSPGAVLEFANQIQEMYDQIVAISDARTPEDLQAEMLASELQAKRLARIRAKGNLSSNQSRQPTPSEQ
jgi:hypothetical protein